MRNLGAGTVQGNDPRVPGYAPQQHRNPASPRSYGRRLPPPAPAMLHTLVALALQVAPLQAPKADSVARDSIARDSAARAARAASADTTARKRRKKEPRRATLTPELERTAFLDATARDILHRARAARLQQDSLLQSYDAKSYQRFSIGVAFKALVRDRLALREESSGRVRWTRRGGVHVELTGSRAVIPIAGKGGQYKADIDMTPIPYFPGREPLFPLTAFGTVSAEVDENEFVHPLATGAEAYYRYRTGKSMTVVLPSRERITVRELEITARRAGWKLFVGSFWFDDRTGQLVRAAYRLSQPMDIWQVASEEEREELAELERDTAFMRRDPEGWRRSVEEKRKEDEVPAFVTATFSPARLDISGITTEYELREGRFWLPRANYAEGTMQLGFVRSPFKVQEKFEYLSVNGLDSLPQIAGLVVSDTVKRDTTETEQDGEIVIGIGDGVADTAAIRKRVEADTTERGRRHRERIARRERQCAAGDSYTRMVARHGGALRYVVAIPCDSTKLLASADLPKSIYDDGEEAFDEAQRDQLLESLDFGLQPSLRGGVPIEPYWTLNLVRYNRVEGLSSAVGARWAPGGGWTVDGQARLGIADLQPNAELNVSRSNARTTLGLGAYRRLAAANDRGDPLSFGAGLSSFLFGRDEGFYYRTAGVELTGRRGRFGEVGWRVFAEDHRDAVKKTDYSLAKTFAGNDMLDNIDAREGFATGAAATLAFSKGLDPRGWRLAGDWRVEGAVGGFDYARTVLDATLSRGLGGRVEGALTGAGGWSGGDLPPQRRWYLGGAQTVRGQVAGTQRGDAFWLGRMELARSWPIMRPVVFGDVGWAGDRARLLDRPGRIMSGAGVGASFLDGLMRVDLSRGIRPAQMWRVDLYLEARF